MKIIYLLLLIFLTFSCTSKDGEKSISQDTTEIIDGYVDSLEWSIWDAKDVKKLLEWNSLKMEIEIKKNK